MTDAKRQTLKEKIAAATSRNEARAAPTLLDRAGETAGAARDKFTAFAREHPIATVAGGLAIGIVVSGLFSRSPTRKAGRFLGRKAAGLAAIGTELAVAYAQHALESRVVSRFAGGGSKAGQQGNDAPGLADPAAGRAPDVPATASLAGRTLGRALRSRLN